MPRGPWPRQSTRKRTTSVPQCLGPWAKAESCLDQPRHRQAQLPMCLPGSAQAENSAWTSQLLHSQIVILWNCSRRLSKGSLGIFFPALMASPGTSSKHCLCTLVGPGHAEAQADELPLHLIAGALTRAICALTSPGTGRPSCLCASLAVPRQTTLPGPASCCTGMARGYIQGSHAIVSLDCLAAQAQAACTAHVPYWALALPRRRQTNYLCTKLLGPRPKRFVP